MVCRNFIAVYCTFFCAFVLVFSAASPARATSSPLPSCENVKVDCQGNPGHRCCGKPAETLICPQILPNCPPGYLAVGAGTTAHGCPKFSCQKKEVIDESCPKLPMLGCKPGEKLTYIEDKKGCKTPKCQPSFNCRVVKVNCQTKPSHQCCVGTPKPPTIICPAIAPNCKPGYVAETNEAGCKVRCVKKEVSCPKYKKPACRRGQAFAIEKDAKGCPKPVCKPGTR